MPNDLPSKDLQALQDLVQAQPTLKKPLLWLELRHIEREKLLCESVQGLVRIGLVDGARSVLSTALGLGVAVLVYTKMVQLAGWLDNVRSVTIPLPPPISRNAVVDLSGYVPSSTAIDVLASLPVISWQSAAKWIAVIVVLVAVEKAFSGYQAWRRAQALRETGEELDAQARQIRAWLEAR